MTDDAQQRRMFSPWARGTLAVFSLLFGLMLALWASDQRELWKYSPALFCFAIFGAIVLPAKIARWCGYAIAFVILVLCVEVVLEASRGPVEGLAVYKLGRLLLMYGLPALVFLLRGKVPFAFGERRPNNALERTG